MGIGNRDLVRRYDLRITSFLILPVLISIFDVIIQFNHVICSKPGLGPAAATRLSLNFIKLSRTRSFSHPEYGYHFSSGKSCSKLSMHMKQNIRSSIAYKQTLISFLNLFHLMNN
jgi:hypothetical protein